MDHELGAAEPIDHVAREPDVTAWKRAARAHQNAWRAKHRWPAGARPGWKEGMKASRRIGSRLDLEFACSSMANFLGADVADAVRRRLSYKADHETLDKTRLYADLLSSMPMCFNLFGSLDGNGELAAAVTARWFPDFVAAYAPVKVEFEWSPGRRDSKYLGDRTAFDAALFVGPGGLIGIETKYHEHAVVEPLMKRNRKTGERKPRPCPDRYVQVSVGAGLLDRDEIERHIWGTKLEQIWRDHLLALAYAQAADPYSPVRYVLVAPSANPAWARLANEYLDAVPGAAATFQYRSVDELIDEAADLLPHAAAFRERYLDVKVGG